MCRTDHYSIQVIRQLGSARGSAATLLFCYHVYVYFHFILFSSICNRMNYPMINKISFHYNIHLFIIYTNNTVSHSIPFRFVGMDTDWRREECERSVRFVYVCEGFQWCDWVAFVRYRASCFSGFGTLYYVSKIRAKPRLTRQHPYPEYNVILYKPQFHNSFYLSKFTVILQN